jgi:hypothetical protein
MRFFLFVLLFAVHSVFSFEHTHAIWDGLVKKHVKLGLVSYKGFMQDQKLLKQYLDSLSSVKEEEYKNFTKEEKLSFLINAYNAFTVQLILDHYPISSIRKIGFLPGAAWRKNFFTLLGEKRNLDWIEHSKLRVDFDEPRIHFAIVCASIGCPHLISEAYVPSKLNSQLQTSMENFLQDKTKNYYDPHKKTLYLSAIFQWFEKDFTKKGSLVQFVKPAIKQDIPQDVKIEFTEYNWNLNEQK